MAVFKGDTVLIPRTLLATLLEHGTFNGDLGNEDHAERAADYIIAVSELGQILAAQKEQR